MRSKTANHARVRRPAFPRLIAIRIAYKPSAVGRAKFPVVAGVIVGGVLAIPGVPGPGIPIIVVAPLLLSDHFMRARRTLAWPKEKPAALWKAKAPKDGSGQRRAPTGVKGIETC